MTSGVCTAVKAEAWADALIKSAEIDRVNNVLQVRFAVTDIHKARRGEQCPDRQPYPCSASGSEVRVSVRIYRQHPYGTGRAYAFRLQAADLKTSLRYFHYGTGIAWDELLISMSDISHNLDI